MMKKSNTLRINLHLPRHWDGLTTKQMEIVAECIMRETGAGVTGGTYNPKKVKMDIFLRFTGLEIVDVERSVLPPEEQYFIARKRNETKGFFRKAGLLLSGKRMSPPFRVYIWQVNQWIEEGLKWLDSTPSRTIFPYPEYKAAGKTFKGPSVLMQNFNYRQFRIVSDYMDYYVTVSNSLVKYATRKDFDPKRLADIQKTVRNARNLLLASLFCEEVEICNSHGQMVKDSPYSPGQEEKNKKVFNRFSDIQMQAVFFWWAGIMGYLQRKYPKVFKKGNPKKQQQVNPFEVYTRIMANLEKYLSGMNEEQINNETYTAVLTHLNDMIAEQEKAERRKK